MTDEESPLRGRNLLRAWAILASLTALSVGAALIGGTGQRSSLIAVAVALIASFIKARQVLDHFLDLRRAGWGWRGLFNALLLLILGLCFALYLAAVLQAPH
ncbi:MAG: cytochrome C oxidase subunit IV family protein [Magnetospirillum sp.]|nr:cytochrome C oxidase subunit IV family protein [Magnetospirillum sp.]